MFHSITSVFQVPRRPLIINGKRGTTRTIIRSGGPRKTLNSDKWTVVPRWNPA